MAFIYQMGGSGAIATKCGKVTGVTLGSNDVEWGASVTLKWDEAQDGIANPVRKYGICKNGIMIGYSDTCEATVFAPEKNGSVIYAVKAIGRISGFDGDISDGVELRANVTDPTPPSTLSFGGVSEVACGALVTLRWSGASAGKNNAIDRYKIYRNNSLVATSEGTSIRLKASAENGTYEYRIVTCGVHTESAKSDAITLTTGSAYNDTYIISNVDVTVPLWARRIDVTCIAAGGGGARGGYNYNAGERSYPAGGGSGGTGEIQHLFGAKVSPGDTVSVTVGKGGAYYNGNNDQPNMENGGDSSFGELLVAAGGKQGRIGGSEPTDQVSGANGGRGGSGGIGGNGGGAGWGKYSSSAGYDGADGESTLDWENWAIEDWYVFRDPSTGKRLGQSGRGGDGISLGLNSTRAARGLTEEEAPGEMYGSGGRGGDQQKNGPVKMPEAGQDGLVAVRFWRYNGTTIK